MKEEVLMILFEIQVHFLMTFSVHVLEFLNLGRLQVVLPVSPLSLKLSRMELSRLGRLHKLGLFLA